jgi:phosphatidylserine/phosphatidylglycerophosphate/cardiolipin synthase-like enzyme
VVTVDDTWLDGANPADLDALAESLLDGRVGERFSTSAIQRAGFEDAVSFLDGLRGTDPRLVAWMLQRIARERRIADDRYAGVARLVWSGASEGEQTLRDTKVVLDELFARAERHVLIATYVIYDGIAVFAKLAERLRARPEIQVDLYVNLKSDTGADADEQTDAAAFMAGFARSHWPSDVPLPEVYYDPETRKRGSERRSLHAKCVVVDQRWAFVTSANFTEAAQDRNIETGVLLDHPRIAEALAGRFAALRESGRMRAMGGGR